MSTKPYITATIRKSIADTYLSLGGDEAYLEWARAHPTIFYDHWMKLLPVELKADIAVTTDFVGILERARTRVEPIDIVGERIDE